MARQDNPFALLGDDEEGADVSVLIAKVEAKIPVLPPPAAEQTKQKTGSNGFPAKVPNPSEIVRGERGRGRGGRGRGAGRGGDAVEQTEHLYERGYSGRGGGGGGGRGGMGRGRGRGFAGFGGRNQMDYGNAGDGGEEGGELQEKSYYGESRPYRTFGDENRGSDVAADRENRGFRGHGADMEKREFRDGEGYERGYGGDGENRGFRGGRGYGGRGRRGGRGGGRYEANDGWNAAETRKASADEKEPAVVSNANNGDGGSGRYGSSSHCTQFFFKAMNAMNDR